MTAVEFAVEKLAKFIPSGNQLVIHIILEEAKEMEKQQIIDAVEETMEEMNLYESFRTLKNGEQYYNETFKNK